MIATDSLEQLKNYCKSKGLVLTVKQDSIVVRINNNLSFSKDLKGADKDKEYLNLLYQVSGYFFERTTRRITDFI